MPPSFYDPTYLQEAHGWQPWQVSMLNLSAGFMAIVGSMVAGRMSDGMGRKRTVKFFFIALPLLIIGYYNASGWLLPVLWAALLFSSVGTTVILSATSNELFPTSYRATAAGATAVLATVSGSLSLTLHGQMVRMPMSPWSAISWLALMLLLAPLLIDRLPETSGRSPEEITPEQAG
ncbi:MAG: MFS transporter [Caldilineaceae bacterium]